MTKKDEVRRRWLDSAMELYDLEDEDGKRQLFWRTCRSASDRFTANELESSIRDMEYWMQRAVGEA